MHVRVKLILLSVGVILGLSLWAHFTPREETLRFEIGMDAVTMNGWKMEPWVYMGTEVTKITVASISVSGLHLEPLGVSSPESKMGEVVVYATYVKGTINGLTASWRGRDVPLEALEILLPKDNACMENVVMEIVGLEASQMKLPDMEISVPSSKRALTASMSYSMLRGWDMRGPEEYELEGGERTLVTKILIENLTGNIHLGWKNCVLGGDLSQQNSLIRSTWTVAGALGFRMEWEGSEEPPNVKPSVGDPALLNDVELRIVYMGAKETILNDAEMRVL